MTIDTQYLGAPPVGLIEKSREVIENIAYFGCCHYDLYVMCDGVSRFSGSVDYSRICIQ